MSDETAEQIQESSTATADSLSKQTVDAAGTLTEAMEYVERARGHLYSFHQLMGHADRLLGEAVDKLHTAGHHDYADRLSEEIVGRDVLPDRWTYQVVEEFDDGYWNVVRQFTTRWTDDVLAGHRHVAEAEMRRARRTG